MSTEPGRVCLLTGAAGRLGSEFCRLYSKQYAIAAVYHSTQLSVASQLMQFVDPVHPRTALEENANPVVAIQADLSTHGGIESVVRATLSRFGKVDLLVNAAVHSVWAPMLESSRLLASAEQQLHINVTVPLSLSTLLAQRFWCHQASENLEQNRNIVNVSSTAASRCYPGVGQSVYAASKAALNQLSLHMAHEFRRIGIRVNTLAPNSFPRIVPTRRVAEALTALDQGKMTGQVLTLDRANK